MNEKKTILSVVFGVSLVSYIVALLSVAIEGITMLDFENITSNYGTKLIDYVSIAGILLIVALVMGIAYALVFAINKKNRKLVNIVCACIITLYFIITAIALKASLHVSDSVRSGRGYNSTEYTMFTAYLTAVATQTVTMLIATVSWLLLDRLNKKTAEVANGDGQAASAGANAEPLQAE